jgi:hypothetical protein
MSAESFISPTVRHVYEADPKWASNESTRRRRGFLSSKHDFDHEGFDLAGFDEEGVDRACFTREDYEADPSLQMVVQACGENILAGKRMNRTFSELLRTTDVIVSELQAAFPDVSFCDAHLAEDAGSHVVVRDAVAGGDLSVAYRQDYSYVAFTTDLIAETFDIDGGGRTGHGVMVYVCDPADSYELRHFAADEAELRAFVREVLADFHPDLKKYGVFITDTPDGPALEASAFGRPSPEDGESELPEFEGDLVGDVLATSPENALLEYAVSRSKTTAVAKMIERGLARLNDPAAFETEYRR